jgi:hypothetical protein
MTDAPSIGQQLLQSHTGDANQAEDDTAPDSIKPESAERTRVVSQTSDNKLSVTPTIPRRRLRTQTGLIF